MCVALTTAQGRSETDESGFKNSPSKLWMAIGSVETPWAVMAGLGITEDLLSAVAVLSRPRLYKSNSELLPNNEKAVEIS